MQQLHGTVMNYAWGTSDAIPAILGEQPSGSPVAEYWLGAHASSPSTLDGGTLPQLIGSDPDVLGGASREAFGDQLSFLLKILSAGSPLSLQAHPNRQQAEVGFARENEAGLALDDPVRSYKDSWPKPEIIVALSPFEALYGFREPLLTAVLFAGLGLGDRLDAVIGPLTHRTGSAALAEVFLDVLSLDDERRQLLDEVAAAAVNHVDDPGELGLFARTIVDLDEKFPGDPGLLGALLMNRLTLQPGEALFVDAGVMHAYLSGTGIEVMGNSDNVIRGGLTAKHIDVEGLLQVVDFTPWTPDVIHPIEVAPGVWSYGARCPEFEVWKLTVAPGTPVTLPGDGSARVALLTAGHVEFAGTSGTLNLHQGQSAFVAADEAAVVLTGDADIYVAASGRR